MGFGFWVFGLRVGMPKLASGSSRPKVCIKGIAIETGFQTLGVRSLLLQTQKPGALNAKEV